MKGVDKVKRLTTCTREWNVGWFPSISEKISSLNSDLFRLKLHLLRGSVFNQFEAPFSDSSSSADFSLSLKLFKMLVLYWFVLSVLSILIFV